MKVALRTPTPSFVDALDAYRDVSPFPVARVQFLRGVMWAEMADRADLAVELYRDAVRRIPGYVVASVHLAELEAENGDLTTARELLEPLVTSGDPEPAGLLAELVEAEDPERAAELAARARARYDDLLARHREAFLDHGAEFFVGPGGQPLRGQELALENLSLRTNARAYLVAIEASESAGDLAAVCSLAADAADLSDRHPVLQQTIESVASDCDGSLDEAGK